MKIEWEDAESKISINVERGHSLSTVLVSHGDTVAISMPITELRSLLKTALNMIEDTYGY